MFAETTLSARVAKGQHFWSEKQFGLELQYDPKTKKLFLHLGTDGDALLGIGRKKIVSKTILYDRFDPQVMARGTSLFDMREEMDAMRALQGLPGLIESEALMTHKDPKSHKKVMTIVTKIYRSGTLLQVIEDHYSLTFHEKLTIAADIITGLASMHDHGYVHRDLSAKNYFVDIKGKKPGARTIKAVVADMGKTIPIKKAIDVPVQGNKTYISPEGFFRNRMKRADYYASDVFALGCVFWRLYFESAPAWQEHHFFIRESISLNQRFKLQVQSIKRARKKLQGRLLKKEHDHKPLTRSDLFLKLVLRMTDPSPKRRGTANELRDGFLALLY